MLLLIRMRSVCIQLNTNVIRGLVKRAQLLWNVHNCWETCTTAGKRALHNISETCTYRILEKTGWGPVKHVILAWKYFIRWTNRDRIAIAKPQGLSDFPTWQVQATTSKRLCWWWEGDSCAVHQQGMRMAWKVLSAQEIAGGLFVTVLFSLDWTYSKILSGSQLSSHKVCVPSLSITQRCSSNRRSKE